MTAALAPGVAAPDAAATEGVSWVYDPWREQPRVAVAALVAALGLCALVVAAREPLLVAAGLCAFCIASFAPALARTEVRLDAEAAARRSLLGWERRRWEQVRRVDALPAAALLSPFAERRWLDRTRALVLPLPADRRGELLAAIHAFREAARGRDA